VSTRTLLGRVWLQWYTSPIYCRQTFWPVNLYGAKNTTDKRRTRLPAKSLSSFIIIHHPHSFYTVSQKTVQFFCQNFVKCPPILIIFGRKRTKRLRLREMYSFSTSPNSRNHTTVLNREDANRIFRDHSIFTQFVHKFWQFWTKLQKSVLYKLIMLLNEPHVTLLCAN